MVHRESSHTCWKERNCGRRSSLQGVCAKGVDSRMEELLSHQTQEAGRFANRTGVLLAEIEVGSGKTDSRCFELLSVFCLQRAGAGKKGGYVNGTGRKTQPGFWQWGDL